MAFSAVIAKPEYDNVIKQNPSGSTYPWSASTGVLDANFADTIGTTDSIQIFTQGYTFAWKPDTVNVIDDTDAMTLLENVNPNAAAQVWNNKVTYVGTTLSTSDEFVVDGNQLKHSVHMVAPPRLPSGFSGTPKYLAIGGDIGTTAQDWADIELIADGESHLTDFITSDDLKFCLKDSGQEVYRIPHITITDNERNETSGQYKLVFNSNDSVTLYMLCPWDWLQQAQYPIIIDPTVIVSSAYDTSGANGRKIVRLSNNAIITVAMSYTSSGNVAHFFSSTDNGQTWSEIKSYTVNTQTSQYVHGIAIASSGTIVYFAIADQWDSSGTIVTGAFDATNVNGTFVANYSFTNQGVMASNTCAVSIEVDSTGALGLSWSSVQPTYPNSYNIRYSKGTVSGTAVTWASTTQITNYNSSTINATNPCIMVNSSNDPIIVLQFANTSTPSYGITCYTYNGSTWSAVVATKIYDGGSYAQNNPGAAVDSIGTIHCVWFGNNSTNPTYQCIFYSKSTDGGNTWSSPVAIVQPSSSHSEQYPTITIAPNNDLYVFWQGVDTSIATNYYQIKMIKFTASTGTWGSPVTITNNTAGNALYPQTLWSEFNMNSSDAIRVIWENVTGSGAVDYYSIALDSPPNAPILNPVANFDATKAQNLSATFSDPDPGDTPSAYQLQILDVVAGTNVVDTGKVASTSLTYNLTANTLPNGKQYQWRMTTWDSQGQQGPWSAYSTFSTAASPTVTVTTPASGGTINSSQLTVQFSYSDPANNAQQSYEVELLQSNDSTVIEDSGTINGTNNAYTLQTVLANTTTYHARVRATNSKGVTSAWSSDVSFSTSFTQPAQPSVSVASDSTHAKISLSITAPTPTGSQPTVSYNDIYRRGTGASAWTRIATQVAAIATYDDYAVASGQGYDYKVTAYGNNGTQIDSAVVSDSVTFIGDWVYNPTSGQQFQFLYNRKAYTMAISEERKEVQTFGTKPMVRRGPLNARTGTLDALMVKIGTGQTPIQQLQAFEADLAAHNAYYLKTAAGEVFKVDLYKENRSMPAENLNGQAIGVSVNWTEVA